MQPVRRHRREIRMNRPNEERPIQVRADVERAHWEGRFDDLEYIRPKHDFSDYESAFRYGWECRAAYGDESWSEVEDDLEAGWFRFRATSPLAWSEAEPAVRDAYEHAGPDGSNGGNGVRA